MSFSHTDYEDVPANFTEGMSDSVVSHTFNMAAGIICTLANVPLLLVFLTHRPFRERFKILISLAMADTINSLAIALMGANRVSLYSSVIATLTIPIRTPWECAIEPWLWLRGVGDLWPPVIQILMGIERVSAVYFPSSYRLHFKRRSVFLVLLSIAIVVAALAVGFLLAWLQREKKAIYYCGRKAAFSLAYGTFIYATNVVAYSIGASLNGVAYLKAKKMTKTSTKQRHLMRLRCYLVISFISTLLVSVPNFISITEVLYKKLANAIAKPSPVLTAVNSGANIFIYFALNVEFRGRCLWLLRGGRESAQTAANMAPGQFGGGGGGGGGRRQAAVSTTASTAASVSPRTSPRNY